MAMFYGHGGWRASRCRSPPGRTVCSQTPGDAPTSESPSEIVLAESDLSLAAVHDRVQRMLARRASTLAPRRAGGDRRCEKSRGPVRWRSARCREGTRASSSSRAAREGARLASVTRRRIVDEKDATEGKETTERSDFVSGQRGHGRLAAPVKKGSLHDGRVIRAHRARPEPSWCAGALHELPRPPSGRRCAPPGLSGCRSKGPEDRKPPRRQKRAPGGGHRRASTARRARGETR